MDNVVLFPGKPTSPPPPVFFIRFSHGPLEICNIARGHVGDGTWN